MPRNRTIYNVLAVYASQTTGSKGAQAQQTGLLDIRQLSRVQSFDEDFTRNFTDVNQYGNLAAIDRIEVEAPDVTASFEYYLTNGINEKWLGLTVAGSGESPVSCVSGYLNNTTAEKNYYLSIVEEGFDANGYNRANTGVIGIGNGFLTSYSVNAAVGEIPSASVEIQGLNVRVYNQAALTGLALSGAFGPNTTGYFGVVPAVDTVAGTNLTGIGFRLPIGESNYTGYANITGTGVGGVPLYGPIIQPGGGNAQATALRPGDITLTLPANSTLGFLETDLKIQDFTLSLDLGRTPLQQLGNRFAFSREIDFPVTATLDVNANIGDITTGNLVDVICSSTKQDFTITLGNPGCGSSASTAMIYQFKGAKLVTQSLSSSIGDNVTMSASYEVQIGSPNDLANGIFISGSFDPRRLTLTSGNYQQF
jgi:hypothetical protein